MNIHRTALTCLQVLLIAGLAVLSACPSAATEKQRSEDFEIRIIDQETRRGIPLVQLTTVNDVRYVTDNAGRIAYPTDDDAGQTVFFFADAQGYEIPKDGFGIAGFRLQVAAGQTTELALKRLNVAERLYRITGRGLYRDSLLVGHDDTPLRHPAGAGQVAGQDSVQPAVYRDRIYWIWGDTSRMSYPLGLFRAAGATSLLPERGGLAPSQGVDLNYFVGQDGFARAMADVPDPKGVVWIDGICTVSASDGSEKLIGHFSRRPGLAEQYEHGIVVYNDEREVFEVASVLPLDETWRFPQSHPTRVFTDQAGQETASPSDDDAAATSWLYFGQPFPVTRVRNA